MILKHLQSLVIGIVFILSGAVAAHAADAPVVAEIANTETIMPVMFTDDDNLIFHVTSPSVTTKDLTQIQKDVMTGKCTGECLSEYYASNAAIIKNPQKDKLLSYKISAHTETALTDCDDSKDCISKAREKYAPTVKFPGSYSCQEADIGMLYQAFDCTDKKYLTVNRTTQISTITERNSAPPIITTIDAAGKMGERISLNDETFTKGECAICRHFLYAFYTAQHAFLVNTINQQDDSSIQGLYRLDGDSWHKIIPFDQYTRSITLSPNNCKIAWMPKATIIKVANLCN